MSSKSFTAGGCSVITGDEAEKWFGDEGDKIIDTKKKEMDVYLKILNDDPYAMLDRTAVMLNPYCAMEGYSGKAESEAMIAWWEDSKTRKEMKAWVEVTK